MKRYQRLTMREVLQLPLRKWRKHLARAPSVDLLYYEARIEGMLRHRQMGRKILGRFELRGIAVRNEGRIRQSRGV